MERFELLNKALLPADKLLDFNLAILKSLKLYDPVRYTFLKVMKQVMLKNFQLMNKLEVTGTENFPSEGGYILAANHQSWLDAQVLSAGLPIKVHFIAKSMLFDFPFLRQLMEMNDTLMIKRGGDEEGLQQVISALTAGKIVCIFPEGTIPGEEDIPRSAVEPDTGLLVGKTGVVRLAIKAKVPIVPIGISGTGQAFPPECYPRLEQCPIPKSAPVTIKVGKPIAFPDADYDTLTRDDLRSMTKTVMKSISELVDFSRSYIPYSVPLVEAPWAGEKMMKNFYDGEKKQLGVLLLHGFTSSIKTVDGLVPYLERHGIPYSVPILRGHGTRYQDLEGVTHDDWYADAEAALKELSEKVDKVVVVGLSMGGLVSLQLAMNHGDRIAAVVTAAAALRFRDRLAPLTPVIAKFIKFWPSPNSFNDKELKKNCKNYSKFPTSAFVSLFNYSKFIEAELPKIKVPALILQSTKDQIVHPDSATIIHNKIASKEKRIVWFKKSGHEMLQDLEAPAVFETIEKYIVELRDKLIAKANRNICEE